MVVKIIAEPSSRRLQLESGDLDIIETLPVDQMAESGDGLPGGRRVVGGEVQAEAVGTPSIGEEERSRCEAEAMLQGVAVQHVPIEKED